MRKFRLAALLAAALVGITGSLVAGAPAQAACCDPVTRNIIWRTNVPTKCLMTSSVNPGTQTWQYACHSDWAEQRWYFKHVSTNSGGTKLYQIINVRSGLCLESGGGHTWNGNMVDTWNCREAGAAAIWWMKYYNGFRLIRLNIKNSAGHYPCLEIDGGGSADRDLAQIWDCVRPEGPQQAARWGARRV